jgi:PilZ domain
MLPRRDCTTRGNSTWKMREFTGFEFIFFPLALKRVLKVQCDVGEFNLHHKPSYPRRFFSRVETRVDVWVYWSFNGRDETSRVRDLSLGGLFVETAKSTAVGASVRLDFLVQEGPIGAEAVVRHVKSGGLGLQLSAIRNGDQKRLKALITRLRK